jgi:uroporphyrinogen decarboxylase
MAQQGEKKDESRFAPLKNDLIIRAAFGQKTERVPVWVMRQAGRYLPEYHEAKGGADFFTVCRNKELASTITLQPVERFPLDAAIIFTDILVVPQALGMEVLMLEKAGPHFPHPLTSPDDLAKLDEPAAALERLAGRVPLIGFSGAPWTLMAYMIEGGGSKMFAKAKAWFYKYPEASHSLMQRLTDTIIIYLEGQVAAGAQLLQIFDSWANEIGPDIFRTFSKPYLLQIAKALKAKHPEVPIIVFAKGANYAIEELAQDSEYDVVGLDWTISPADARLLVKGKCALQGNLDPCALYSSKEVIREEVRKMLQSFGSTQGLIANLGHGLHPTHNPELVGAFIDAVHELSEEMNRSK